MFKTTGEQVGHLMFRKSALVKEHEKVRKHQVNHESFEAVDIETYRKKEAQEYFLEPNEESEKEKQIADTIKNLSMSSENEQIVMGMITGLAKDYGLD